jgi:hypothetical protein
LRAPATPATNTGNGSINIVQLSATFAETGSIQYDDIATSGTYAITADGAKGGGSGVAGSTAGAPGAALSGDIYLTQGTVLEIVVGGTGITAYNAGGGGGGSFVFETLSSGVGQLGGGGVELVLAAGGGGAAYYSGGAGGETDASGGAGGGSASSGYGGGAGGTNGRAPPLRSAAGQTANPLQSRAHDQAEARSCAAVPNHR